MERLNVRSSLHKLISSFITHQKIKIDMYFTLEVSELRGRERERSLRKEHHHYFILLKESSINCNEKIERGKK